MTRADLPRITPTGLTVAIGALGLAVSGWALGYATLTIIAAGALVALTFAAVFASGVPDLALEHVVDMPRVQRGEAASALVAAENRGPRRTRTCTIVETIGDLAVERSVPSLAPGRSSIARFALPTTHRGRTRIGPLLVVQTDPFGFFRSVRSSDSTVSLFVQPRIHALDPRPGGRMRHLDGPLSDGAPQGTITFHSLREYTYGDDVRRVHWRSSARTGTLMVREHVDTSLPSTVVLLDTRVDSYEGDDFEAAVDVAASLVEASQRNGYHVHLITTCGTSLNLRAGHRGNDVRDFLTSVQPSPHTELDVASNAVVRTRNHDAIAIIGGHVTASMLSDITRISHRFSNATLVTIRPDGNGRGLRFGGGLHLDGPTADDALRLWHAAPQSARPNGATR